MNCWLTQTIEAILMATSTDTHAAIIQDVAESRQAHLLRETAGARAG